MTTPSARVRLTRRAALAGLGVTGLGALVRPILARAQTGLSPQRLLLIHRPCGTVPDHWWPTGGVTGWQTSPILSSFDKLRDEMVVLKGVDCPRIQEWIGSKEIAGVLAMMGPPPKDPEGPALRLPWPFLPGTADNEKADTNSRWIISPDETIDQLFSRNIGGLRGAPIPSMQLGASTEFVSTGWPIGTRVVSYAKGQGATPSVPLSPETRPSVAFQNIFGATMGVGPASALDKSLLDFIAGDLGKLRARVPASELPKVDAHLTAIRDLEKNIASSTSQRACASAVPPGPLPVAVSGMTQDEAQYTTACAQHAQIIKSALQCDLTRVVTYSYAPVLSALRFSKILPPGAILDSEGYHDISHGGGDSQYQYLEAQIAIEKFYADTTASLLLDMKNTPDGAGSLLDNTLVVYWNNLSVGNAQGLDDMPVVLFGGKFLNLQGGKYLQFGNHARTMADVWVATAQAWGYSDFTAYGDAMWNRGPMTGLYGA